MPVSTRTKLQATGVVTAGVGIYALLIGTAVSGLAAPASTPTPTTPAATVTVTASASASASTPSASPTPEVWTLTDACNRIVPHLNAATTVVAQVLDDPDKVSAADVAAVRDPLLTDNDHIRGGLHTDMVSTVGVLDEYLDILSGGGTIVSNHWVKAGTQVLSHCDGSDDTAAKAKAAKAKKAEAAKAKKVAAEKKAAKAKAAAKAKKAAAAKKAAKAKAAAKKRAEAKESSPPSLSGVHPGAFCSPEGALGTTSRGTPMICGPTARSARARWHAA